MTILSTNHNISVLKRLWHQLSVGLEGFIKDATNHRGNNIFEVRNKFTACLRDVDGTIAASYEYVIPLNVIMTSLIYHSPLQLYTEFIFRFEGKLSQIRVALLASMVGRLYTQHEAAITFLEKVLLARIRLGTEASLVLDMDIVILKLKLGQNKGAKEALADAKEKTLSLTITEPIVFSRFFKATAEYRKVRFS